MDMPDAFRWLSVALMAAQLVHLGFVLHRVRRGAVTRKEGGIRLADEFGGFAMFAGIVFDVITLAVVGFLLMCLHLGVRGVVWFRARPCR